MLIQKKKKKKNPIITSQHFFFSNLQNYNIVRYKLQKEAKALWIIHFPFALYQKHSSQDFSLETEAPTSDTCNSVHLFLSTSKWIHYVAIEYQLLGLSLISKRIIILLRGMLVLKKITGPAEMYL